MANTKNSKQQDAVKKKPTATKAPGPLSAKSVKPKVNVAEELSKKAGAKNPSVQISPTEPVLPSKAERAKKTKLVRDSFTIPKAEFALLSVFKQRAALLGHPIKKSELLRAGIKLLANLPDGAFLAALKEVPVIKTGRPALKK